MTDFKVFDPNINNLPTTGGTLTGNLTVLEPYKFIQTQAPTDPSDVVNKMYADSFKYGSYIFKSVSEVNIDFAGDTVVAFSTAFGFIGPSVWLSQDVICTMYFGVVTIQNKLDRPTCFTAQFTGCDTYTTGETTSSSSVSFYNNDTNSKIGATKDLTSFTTGGVTVTSPVFLCVSIVIPAFTTINICVKYKSRQDSTKFERNNYPSILEINRVA
jgi:hypothetical protein